MWFRLTWAISCAEVSFMLIKKRCKWPTVDGTWGMWLQRKKGNGKRIWILNVEEKKLFFHAFSRLLVGKILLHIENSISLMVQIKT